MSLSLSFHSADLINTNTKSFQDSFLQEKLHDFNTIINDDSIGFFHLSKDLQPIQDSQKIVNQFSHKKCFVQVGIGGSSLGPEMLIDALGSGDKTFYFFNNIDPDHIHSQLSKINLDETLFYFVSKSGGTAETLASLSIIVNELAKHGVSEDNLKDYFVFATDPKSGDLLRLGKDLKIKCLIVPQNVGGRFSVLTPVGILPLLFAGHNAEELFRGAQEIKSQLLTDDYSQNILLQSCSNIFELSLQRGINQTVLMPYSSKLRNFSSWFVQLWAESLGKKENKQGDIVHTGLTPIPAYGATDQHSQMQLFMDGPFNKLLILIKIDSFKNDYSLKCSLETPNLDKLSQHSLSGLMEAELQGTIQALKDASRPHLILNIEKVDEFHLGQLIMYFESLTALMGHYFNIDPFNQPGVEAGKRHAFNWLKKH